MASTSGTLCHTHAGAASIPLSFAEEEQIPSPPPPPPTPCNHSLSAGETDAFLSHLLTRLSLPPPALTPVLPLRPKQKTLIPPVISLHEPNKQLFLSAAMEVGFFHVSDHDIPLPLHEMCVENYRSKLVVPDTSDLDRIESDNGEHICIFEPDSSDKFARELVRVGLKVLEFLFEEKEIATETSCLIGVVPNKIEKSSIEKVWKERVQNCILQLTYEGRGAKVQSTVSDDSGKWVLSGGQEELVLVTIGEVAQVWSNGRFKKAGSLPLQSPSSLRQGKDNGSGDVLVMLFITVPVGGIITPLVQKIQDANISS